ncbi:MAG: transglutaminase family protein [Verrucomicrobiales bacterium]|nr:transglutaminase family protein [Verrucomicrobiales bacterium]
MRRLKIEHLTTYQFGHPVELGQHKLHVRPREGHDVRIESSQLRIGPAHEVRWHRDFYGNSVAIVDFLESASNLTIASEVVIQHFNENPHDFLVEPWAVNYPFEYPLDECTDLAPYRQLGYPADWNAGSDWVARFWRRGLVVPTFTLLDLINQVISREFTYAERHEEGVQSPMETLRRRSGSCRDFATLFMETCRALAMPARFVSGYLCGPSITHVGGATHAWAEIYLPGAGWRGFDSTSGEMTGSSHIAAAVSRHPQGVPPVSGSFTGPAGAPPQLLVGVRTTVL